VQRIFQEENVHYRVDERGGVHFRFDQEFEHNRATTIATLQSARYRAALTAFELGMAALAKGPPDGKTAIRSTFAAAEGLFRLMFANSPRLTAGEAQKLELLLQKTYQKEAMSAASKLLSAFKDWIEAAHVYRHEPGTRTQYNRRFRSRYRWSALAHHSFAGWLSSTRWNKRRPDGD
jgi:hypothetical protein